MTKSKNPKFWIEKPCVICATDFWSLIKRNQKTCSAKCAGKYVANNPNRIAKIKKSKKEKYGSSSYVNADKTKKTCLIKYGVDNPSKSVTIIDKIKSSNKKKYGVDWSFQSEKVKSKIKKTNIKNHGVEHVSQRADVKSRVKSTFINKYGVDNAFQSNEIKRKIEKTYIEKYNVKHSSQINAVKEIKHLKWKESFYNYLTTNHKLNQTCEPLFTKQEYVNSNRSNLYKFRCKQCNSVFDDHIDGGHVPRCLTCSPLQAGYSKSEQDVQDYVAEIYNGEILYNTRSILPSGLELDIYIPEKKLAIEYNGLYWHSEIAGKDKKYHLNKTIECEKNNIHLIHIFEDEWKHKNEIIKQKIKSKLIFDKKIGGRCLTIKAICSSDKNRFLEKYHIQGKDNSSVIYGAFYNKELVAVCTFAKPRVALGNKNSKWNNEYELVRYATSMPIIGAMNKFISVFRKEYMPKKIFSYADRRFSNIHKNIYRSSGFTLTRTTAPNYWYFENGRDVRWHRYNFRKNILSTKLNEYNSALTEWNNMINNNYNRIWDCGNLRFEI